MKYSFMTFSCPELSLQEALSVAGRFGYDAIEPRIQSEHKHGIELDAPAKARAAARRAAEESGIALCCIATSCCFADPTTAAEHVETARAAIDLARDVGASRIRVFGGRLPDGVGRGQAIDLVVRSLSLVADQAEARGVTICMETHDAWCDPEDVAEVMRRIDHPAVAVNWDIMHPVRVAGASIDHAWETLKPWVRHVHFHDGVPDGGLSRYGVPTMALAPVGRGEIDHERAVRLLQEAGYSGYLSGEWINWEPWEDHLPRELEMMKGYEQ